MRLVDDYLPGAGGHGNILVQLPGYTGLLLAHSEVGPDQPSDYDEGVMFAHFTAVADNIHDVDDAFFIGAGGGDGSAPDSPRFGRDVRIQDCYIHDLIRFSARHHNDGVQFVSGADVLIEHNWIDLGHQEDSAVFLAEDVGAITGVRVVGNYLDGGSFTIFSLPGPCPPGPGGRPDCARRRPPPSGVTVADNWFGPDALYGLLYQYGGGLAWSGNRMYPSGTPVAYPAVTGNPAQRSQITLPVPTAPG